MGKLGVYWETTGLFPSLSKIKCELSSNDERFLQNMKYFLKNKINTFGDLTIFLMDLVSMLDYEDDTVNRVEFHMIRKWFLGNLAICLEGNLIYPFYDNHSFGDNILSQYSSIIDNYVKLSELCRDRKSILSSGTQIIPLVEHIFVLDCFLRDVTDSNCDGVQMMIDHFHRQQYDFD